MSFGADFFLKKTLGEDFMESLAKTEIYKIGTRTVVDTSDMHLGLKIVPRTLMSFLIHSLTGMNIGETKELDIPVSEIPAMLRVTKMERDSFSGQLEQDNKKIAEFMHRSIPGIGLVLMSALELYQTEDLIKEPEHKPNDQILDKVQKMIDERLALHDLIGKVVDKKITERDAVQQLILAKLSEELKKKDQIVEITKISESSTPNPIEYHRGMTNGLKVAESIVTGEEPKFLEPTKKTKKSLPLNDFLEGRKSKKHKDEHVVILNKGESVHCPDCGKEIFKDLAYSGCVCFGQDMDSNIYIKKSEDGIKVRFGSRWDPENIELLLEVLRGKRER